MQPVTLPSSTNEGPLVASPKQAMNLLQVGRATLYSLLDRGELESFRVGRSRRITIKSVNAYVERCLEQDAARRAGGR